MKKRKVAVTGGTGFLGFHLVPILEEYGFEVILLKRDEVDFSDVASIAKKCDGAYAMIHGAGVVSYRSRDQEAMYATHIELTRRLLLAAKSAKISRFIHVSSIVTLGYGQELRDERSDYNAAPLHLSYWDTKYDAEQMALSAEDSDFEVIVVNPGTFLGEGERGGELTAFIRKLADMEVCFVPSGGSDFLDARDAALGCVLALERGKSGERYILGSENLSYKELHQRLRNILGKTSTALEVPHFLLKIVERLVFLCEKFFKRELSMNSARLRRVNGIRMFHDLSKAKIDLGFIPRPIDQAVLAMLGKKIV